MPLDKFVLILVLVIAAAGVTVALGAFVFAGTSAPAPTVIIALPVILVAYVLWRVLADRIGNREDDHYDRIEK